MSNKQYWVMSGYGANTRQPYVEIESPELKTQMSPQDARQLAMNILSASEAALSDAFLVTFILEKIEGELHEAAGLLNEFREWRESNVNEFRNNEEK